MYSNSPLEQFEIIPYLHIYIDNWYSFSFTNQTVYTLFIFFAMFLFFFFHYQWFAHVFQFFVEFIYIRVQEIMKTQVKDDGLVYFPFVLSLFFFVLFANVIGLVPFSFTVTSHIIITFLLAFLVYVGIQYIGLSFQGLAFFVNMFVPKGVPFALVPFITLVEVISYIFRVFSLSIRLFANMVSGHTLLHIITTFCLILLKTNYFFGILSLILPGLLFILEFFIAILQAYVFVVLTCIYINDVLAVHH